MRTFAEYLNTMTVKTLNSIAKDMGLKGYSKLRKAALIMIIDDAIAALVPVILDTEVPADHDAIAALIAEFATTPAQIDSPAAVAATPTNPTDDEVAPSLDDLKDAYRHMRKTVNNMRGGPSRVRCVGRLRNLSAELRKAGVKYPQYL
jgi:hypothetical protein